MSVLAKIARAFVGTKNDRELRRYGKDVTRINELEQDFEKLSDSELKAKTESFRQRFADGETLDDLLPEAFAAVREASKRTIGCGILMCS
jgi:preprotein translocase subunit SecA